MAATFEIARSNVLRFCRTDNTASVKKTLDNTLLPEWLFTKYKITSVPYFQKFNIGDEILIQFITNYANIEVLLNDYDSNEMHDYSGDLETVFTYTDGTGNIIYNLHVDTSALGGRYNFVINATDINKTTLEYTSEWIEINDFEDYPLIQWRESRFDGITYTLDTIFGFRIDGYIAEYTPTTDTTVYEGFEFEPVNLKSVAKRIINLQVDPIPFYIAEKLVLALTHEELYINDVLYVAKSGGQPKAIKNTYLYEFEASLQQVQYENYLQLAAIEEEPTDDIYILSYDGVNSVTYDGTNRVKI